MLALFVWGPLFYRWRTRKGFTEEVTSPLGLVKNVKNLTDEEK